MKQRCRICRCTDERACDEGCYWVEYDLCSVCAERLGEARDAAVAWIAAGEVVNSVWTEVGAFDMREKLRGIVEHYARLAYDRIRDLGRPLPYRGRLFSAMSSRAEIRVRSIPRKGGTPR